MLIQADAALIPFLDKTFHCVVTSPPYWGLRKYKGEQQRVWGGDAKCEHVWGETYYGNTRPYGAGLGKWQHGIDKVEPGRPHIAVEQGQFCQLCGAWYGALGLEPTPELHIEHVVEIFREIRRVLRDDGVVYLNYGDCFAGSGKGQMGDGSASDRTGSKQATSAGILTGGLPNADGLPQGNLMLMPHRIAIALQSDGWIVRNDCPWNKSNPMPESVHGWSWSRHRIKQGRSKHATEHNIKGGYKKMLEDASVHQGINEDWVPEYVDCPGCEKCEANDGLILKRGSWRHTRAHEYIFQLVKGPKMNYYSNQEAVREDVLPSSQKRASYGFKPIAGDEHNTYGDGFIRDGKPHQFSGRNPRSVLDVPTQPYSMGTQTYHWRRVARDVASDGMIHIAFPYCPEHETLALQIAKGFYDGHEADYWNHIERIYNHLAQERPRGFFPTHHHDERCSEACNSDWLPPVYSPAAIDHNNASHKMALALGNAIPYMPFFEMIDYIADKRELLSYFVQHLCIYGSRILSDDFPASLSRRIPHRTLDKSQAEILKASDCSCLIYEHYTKKADHYATFPPNLIAPLIRASCPKRCCPECGAPWAPVVEKQGESADSTRGNYAKEMERIGADNKARASGYHGEVSRNVLDYRPTCSCERDDHIPGIVLDPFIGSGTTGMVARELGRRWVGLDISMEYLDQQAKIRSLKWTPSDALVGLPLFEGLNDEKDSGA